jgi:hypothetical protein
VTHLERQGLLNAANSLSRFMPRDAVAVLAKHTTGALVLRAHAEDESGAEMVVAGTRWSGGEVVLPLDALRQVLRFSDANEVAIRTATDEVRITGAGARHSLAPGEAEHSSRAPAIEGPSVSFSRGVLAQLLRRVAFARGTSDRPGGWAVDCVRIAAGVDGLEVSASDLYIHATASAPAACARSFEAIVPFGVLSRWSQGCFAADRSTLTVSGGTVALTADGVTAWGPTRSGTFPPVALATLPPHSIPLAQELRAALALIGSDDVEVTLTISPTSITLQTPGLTSVVPVRRHRGPAVTVLLEGVRFARATKTLAATGCPVVLHYESAEKPIVLVAGEARCVQAPHILRAAIRPAARSVA